MKSLFALAVVALTLMTGFTCSKNTPEAVKNEAPAAGYMDTAQPQPSQEQMAQPPSEPPPPTMVDGSSGAATPDPETK